MSSYTITSTETFNLTHARYIASKVATDLSRFRRFYNDPSFEIIAKYEEEIVALLNEDYLDNVTYGFKKNGYWIEAIRYHALPGGQLIGNDDPGKIRPGIDVSDAIFSSYLIHNSKWFQLTQAQRESFEMGLPFQRSSGSEPVLQSGYWSNNLNYSAGGRGIARSTIIR